MKTPGTGGEEPRRVDVQEEGRVSVHGPRAKRPASGRGNVFFVGLRGSGKTTLGRLVAERLGRPFTDEPDWKTLAGLAKQGGQVAAIAPELLAQDGVCNLLSRGGKVFYIMTDAATLAARLGKPGDVPLREELYEESTGLEPLCMQALHFILQGASGVEVLVEDVIEKLAITGDA
jgi:shikimate kinase